MNAESLRLNSNSWGTLKRYNTVNSKELFYCSDKCVKIDAAELSSIEKDCMTKCLNLVIRNKKL